MDPSISEVVLTALVAVIGGNKGLEMYKHRKYNGKSGNDRRKSVSNGEITLLLSNPDREFISSCFNSLEQSMDSHFTSLPKDMEIDRMKLLTSIKEDIQDEGAATRALIRASSQ